MTEVILWHKSLSSDKIWGVNKYKEHLVTFWGRRERELKFKLLSKDEKNKIDKIIKNKINRRHYRQPHNEVSYEDIREEAAQCVGMIVRIMHDTKLGNLNPHGRGVYPKEA